MKKIILVLIYLGYFLYFGHTIADYPPPETQKSSINELIAYYGSMYDVSQETLLKTIKCESSLNPNAHNLTKKEDSYGLAQINLKAHKSITKEQALDQEFSIEFMAKNISKGKGKMWTCFES